MAQLTPQSLCELRDGGQFTQLPTLLPWTNYFTFLSLFFPVYKMGTVIGLKQIIEVHRLWCKQNPLGNLVNRTAPYETYWSRSLEKAPGI